jgi:hypothetical protein
MRRILLLTILLSGLAACSDDKSKLAAEQEKAELTACRTTYPVRPGLFAARARCELGAAANYVQMTDPGETQKLQRVTTQLEADADGVDAGISTPDAWRAKLGATLDGLPDRDKRVKEGAGALL